MHVMNVPTRIHGVRRFLGEGPGVPSKAPKPDIDHVLTLAEIGQLSFANREEAVTFYKSVVRTVALMTKMAFVTDLWKTVKTSPEMIGAMAVTENGRAWLDAFVNSEAAFLSFTQPNYFQSLNLVRSHMEVNVLPKVYKVGVKGRLPAFIPGAMELSYSDVVTSTSGLEAFDFGDLQKSSVKDDIDTIEAAASMLKVKPQLGAVPVVVIVVSVVIVIVSTYLYAGWVDYLETRKIPPELRKVLEKADPQTVERILERFIKVQGMFSGVADVFMWGAIGAGIVVIGGTIFWIATKD